MSNNTQNANYWFNNFIITICSAVVKTTRKHLPMIFKGLMLCIKPLTFYSWIRAAGCQHKYQVEYYQLMQIGKRKMQLEKTQHEWTIEQLAPYLRKCSQIYIVGDDTQTNHPGPKIQGGRPRKPRREVYDMSQCAVCENHPWKSVVCKVYGNERQVEYKEFRVRSNISEGEEVLVIMSRWVPDNPLSKQSKESKPQWILLVSTNLSRTAQEIIEAYSNRFSIEETFKELKEVEGIGKPQVRNLESTEATFLFQLFAYVLVELWSWNQDETSLKEFRGLADDQKRRPSHADKRKQFRLQLLELELLRLYPARLNHEKIKTILKCLNSMGI